jgi:hypothetical protein
MSPLEKRVIAINAALDARITAFDAAVATRLAALELRTHALEVLHKDYEPDPAPRPKTIPDAVVQDAVQAAIEHPTCGCCGLGLELTDAGLRGCLVCEPWRVTAREASATPKTVTIPGLLQQRSELRDLVCRAAREIKDRTLREALLADLEKLLERPL